MLEWRLLSVDRESIPGITAMLGGRWVYCVHTGGTANQRRWGRVERSFGEHVVGPGRVASGLDSPERPSGICGRLRIIAVDRSLVCCAYWMDLLVSAR